jgi:hypothetical protein
MRKKTKSLILISVLILASGLIINNPVQSQIVESWQIVIPKSLQNEEATRVVIEDLKNTAENLEIGLTITDDQAKISQSLIVVGNSSVNMHTRKLQQDGKISLKGVNDDQGYEIITTASGSGKIMVIAGETVIGNVYGLYWLWDRMRVYKTIPDINTIRIPALKTRMSLAWGRHPFGGGSKETMQQALRQSINWVSGAPILDLVPWESDPEKSINAENRKKTNELIDYAHSIHMKYFCFANEFTYHPSLLKETNASLSPCDPNFWNALQEKYRKLFTALPKLDGIEVCNDDISGFWDAYRGFDLMHKGEGCEWPYTKRFQTFVRQLWEVVVGEFDKTYFHFTWGLVPHEQHYSPEVFKEIFTEDLPVKNLLLIPKITAGDRWWHQPYNYTFNLSPQKTLVAFETMNYYEGGSSNIFPTFSGQYFQGGLQTFLRPEDSNVRGAGFLVRSPKKGWDTPGAYTYVLYRLSWDPYEDIGQIAEDFCAIYFGREAAKEMAEIYLKTSVAYKYGLHIEPVSYGRFNSFIHMRVNVFPAMGYPRIDDGREHMEFLETIYLRCKPWQVETIDDLDHGLATAKKMVETYKNTKSKILDKDLAQELENKLNMTRWLIETNNAYVKTTFDYFDYRKNPNEVTKQNLRKSYDRLLATKNNFMSIPGYGYKLFGVDQLIKNAGQAIEDLSRAEQKLASAPSRNELEHTITKQQELYRQLLKKYKEETVKLLHIEVKVDGRDLLIVTEDNHRIQNLRWDGAHVQKLKFFTKLPKQEVTVIPRDIKSRPMHPFILEQPSAENDYTVTVYLYDKPGADGIMEFELYYIPKAPEQVGLNLPWKK